MLKKAEGDGVDFLFPWLQRSLDFRSIFVLLFGVGGGLGLLGISGESGREGELRFHPQTRPIRSKPRKRRKLRWMRDLFA